MIGWLNTTNGGLITLRFFILVTSSIALYHPYLTAFSG